MPVAPSRRIVKRCWPPLRREKHPANSPRPPARKHFRRVEIPSQETRHRHVRRGQFGDTSWHSSACSGRLRELWSLQWQSPWGPFGSAEVVQEHCLEAPASSRMTRGRQVFCLPTFKASKDHTFQDSWKHRSTPAMETRGAWGVDDGPKRLERKVEMLFFWTTRLSQDITRSELRNSGNSIGFKGRWSTKQPPTNRKTGIPGTFVRASWNHFLSDSLKRNVLRNNQGFPCPTNFQPEESQVIQHMTMAWTTRTDMAVSFLGESRECRTDVGRCVCLQTRPRRAELLPFSTFYFQNNKTITTGDS